MPIKLIVTQETDPEGKREFGYDAEVVTIGRDQANALYLPDSEKKLVSRKHAQIERHGDNFNIVDLESRNATFLNGTRLEAKKPYPLKDGDLINIGAFMIAFVELPPAADIAALPPIEPPAAVQPELARRELETRLHQAQTEIHRLRQENQRLLASTRSQDTFAAGAATPRLQRILDVLLEATAKLIQAPDQFREEFEGVSVMFNKERGSAKALKEYLFDPSIPEAEAAKRLAQYKHAIEKDIVHQVALLAGYKTSVQEGSRQLLQNLAPATLQQKTADKKFTVGPLEISYRYVPLFFQWKWLQMYRQKHRELLEEARGVLEKRFFHQAFLKGYHAAMDSIWRDEGDKK